LYTPEQSEKFHRMGDVNRDGVIDDTDINLIKTAYGSKPGDPNWNPDCDLNSDGVVDVFDASMASRNRGLTIDKVFTHMLTVESEPQGAPFTINDVATATRYSQTLQEGIYTISMPRTFNSYSFTQWEDGFTDPTRTINLTADTTMKAIYAVLAAPAPPTPTPPTAPPPTVEIIPPTPAPPTVIPPAPAVPPAPVTPETAGLIVLGVLAVVTIIGIGVAVWYFSKPPS